MIGSPPNDKAGAPESFYASKAWRAFRLTVIAERGLKCEHCGRLIARVAEAHVHHTPVFLTAENYKDALISLNPANVKVVHRSCHNRLHPEKGERAPRKVYLVYGMPGSGKTSYVMERKGDFDLVLDMDMLYQGLTGLPLREKPSSLFGTVRGVWNYLLDVVKTRNGRWKNAWVIGGFPDKYQRDKVATDLGAEVILMDCEKEEALERLALRDPEMLEEYTKYVDDWIRKLT